jgi:hypothetical protein
MTADDFEDNIHQILHESALREQSFSIFDFNDSFDPKPVSITPEQAEDTLRTSMSDSIDEEEKSESGEIEKFDNVQEKTCQTFFMPTQTKKLFEEICKNNYTTPSCFLRNVCQRLVESYYGKREE